MRNLSKKLPGTLTTLVGWLSGLVIVYLLFRSSPMKNEAISNALKGSGYEELEPYIQAQAKHETGNFTSRIYLQNHNLFGMRFPSSRDTTAIDNRDNYAYYNNDEDSVKDLVKWLEYTGVDKNPAPKTLTAYVAALKRRGYFEDSIKNYMNGLKSWL